MTGTAADGLRARGRRPRRRRPGTLALHAAGLAALLLVVALAVDPGLATVAQGSVVVGTLGVVSALSAVVTGAAAVRSRPLRTVWTTTTAVLLLFVVPDVAYVVEPRPATGLTWTDGVYATAYALFLTLPFVFLRAQRLRPHPTVWLDGATAGAGTLALAAALVLGPAYRTDHATLLSLAYVAADLVVVALLVSLASVLERSRDVVPFLLAAVLQMVGDLFLAVGGASTWAGLAGLLYVVVPLLVAWAAHRTPAGWTVAAPPWRPRLAVRTVLLPLAGAGGALAVLTTSAFTRVGALPVLLAVLALLTVVVRTVLTLRATESFYEVRAQALLDPVTGLGNRRALDEALAARTPPGLLSDGLALLLVDLDSFGDVNDALGHLVGDEVLRLQAARLAAGAPHGWVVVRIAGDTFAVVLPDADPIGAEQHAQELAARLGHPLRVAGTRVRLSASVGVAITPVGAGAEHATTVVRRAHDALAEAKRSSAAVVVDRLDQPARVEVARLHLAEELRTALAEDQLVLWFQPQLHLTRSPDGGGTTTVAGCEALVRWAHPVRGLLGAGQVLAAAEHGRLLPALGDAVLRKALAAARTWWDDTQVPVSVNLAATDLDDPLLPDWVAALLDEAGLPPWALTVEVVEDSLVLDSGRTAQVLRRLCELGVGIAIDDYGTGYSSLAYLHELPVDELKLDRSLTVDLTSNPAAAAIARHSIALAHELGLRVVGEGIEEPAALAALTAMGCDVVQGYLTGAPMPHAEWLAWLADRPVRPSRPAGVPS